MSRKRARPSGSARELVAAENLTADIAVTRWHPVEEAWKDASIPLPETPEGEREELRMHEAEAEREGAYEWLVKLDLPSRAEAAELQERLAGEGLHVHRRWRYVTIDVVTEEQANESEPGCAERSRTRSRSGSSRAGTSEPDVRLARVTPLRLAPASRIAVLLPPSNETSAHGRSAVKPSPAIVTLQPS